MPSMDSIGHKVKEYLTSLDTAPYRKIGDFEVGQGILALTKEGEEKPEAETLYEIYAFDLFPRHEGHVSEWGTYFGSKMTFRNEEGDGMMEYPSMQKIDKDMVAYWAQRALEARHPILVERYADLVGDFSAHVDRKFDYKLAQLAIDSIIAVCEQDLVQDTYQVQKLHRALSKARAINDTARLRAVADVIIETEKKIAEDSKPGLWGFPLRWLVLENQGEDILELEEVLDLIQGLEERMARLLAAEDPDPWGVECVVNLLAPYYAKNKDGENTLRVLLCLEESYRRNKRSNSDGLLRANYIEKLDALYRQNGSLPGMQAHIERIARELPEVAKEALASMKTVSVTGEIEKKDIERITDAIFRDSHTAKSLSLDEVILRLIGNFFVKRDNVKKQLDDQSKKFVFRFIVQQRRLSADGHTEAIIPPLEEDYEAHLYDQAFQSMQFSAPFFANVMQTFKESFSPQDILSYFEQSPLFIEDEKEYLLEGLTAYWDGKYLTASENFMPYLEAAFRRLVAGSGGITLRPGHQYGGYQYLSLNTLLDDEIVDRVFGFNVSFYFKSLLTHPLGWNLRNNLAHGVNLNSFLRQDVADRLFHILLFLGLVRKEASH